MNRWERLLPPTPFPGASTVAWPVGQPAPGLPAGKAGISVRIRTRTTDPANWVSAKAVGVDDQPMWHGVGRMVVVTDPGEHLVEVRGRLSAETARRVRLRAGEIAELEYWTPASFGGADGVLVPAPARRRLGSGVSGIAAAFLTLACVALVADAAGVRPNAALVAALFAITAAATVLIIRAKRRVDRRYRAEVSHEVDADARTAETGAFLGDGTPPPSLADGGHGVLVVTATATREYVWNGTQVAARPSVDPNAWLPWPSLLIDGVGRPLSWRTWCYRLPPGRHEVTVTARPPLGGAGAVGVRPATVTVEVAAGQETRLDLRVKARVEVRSASRDRSAPTELTGFEADVRMTASGPAAAR
ncbi:hypothetical protein AB0J14_19530 [Micromonospora arborensis]|uniref:hypothetical protein n=1 Tax=Micromonospora arborensis TaxID=2116518 RepID=UPI0033D07D67